jgi:hypothetical protein
VSNIQIDGFEGGGRLYTMGGGGGVTTTLLKKVGWDASYALEMADFAAAVLAAGRRAGVGGRGPPADADMHEGLQDECVGEGGRA